MKINHIMLGAHNVSESAKFYNEFLKFEYSDENAGMKGGQVMFGKGCDLLILPLEAKSLPNPKHFAFEVDSYDEFLEYFEKAKNLGLNPRSMPQLDSEKTPGDIVRGNDKYKIFYFFDPSKINLELMVKL